MNLYPPLYVVKVKHFGTKTWSFSNNTIMEAIEETLTEEALVRFIFKDLTKARKTMSGLILQRRQDIEAIKIVNLSHYPPYSDFEVVAFYEAKVKS